MLTAESIALARASYAGLARRNPDLVTDFYTRLFVTAPEVRGLFNREIHDQADKLEATLQVALSALSAPAALLDTLHSLGQVHAAAGVTQDHYQTVTEVLLDTMADAAGDDWTPEVSQAWGGVLSFVSGAMTDGARHLYGLAPA